MAHTTLLFAALCLAVPATAAPDSAFTVVGDALGDLPSSTRTHDHPAHGQRQICSDYQLDSGDLKVIRIGGAKSWDAAGLLSLKTTDTDLVSRVKTALTSSYGPANRARGQSTQTWSIPSTNGKFAATTHITMSENDGQTHLILDRRRSEADPKAAAKMAPIPAPVAPTPKTRTTRNRVAVPTFTDNRVD